MPGMMDTILNLGLTPETTGAFAAACRARLEAMFRQTVGAEVPDDPWAQLRQAIEAVFRSWNGDRARAYRAKEGIPDDLGTGVVVQAMVFGNRGPDSGTGVLFTRNPATGERALYGDVMFDAQGEDVVAGTHATEPISVLDERMPAVADELRDHADRLERHYADMCDIEFTIEDGRLWLLQVRVGKRSPQAALRIAVDMAEDDAFPLSRADAVERVRPLLADPPVRATSRSSILRPLVTGLPASPGTASGEIATTPEAAVEAAAAGRPVILVRSETSPDDVHGMAKAAGILTAKGGLASHAAVVARGWGIPAVVGASAVQVGDRWVALGDRRFRAGDTITIDGGSGEVFEGAIPGTTEPVPEAATLLGWARELGITIGEAGAAREPTAGQPARRASMDDLIRALGIKGFATRPGRRRRRWLSSPDQVQPLLDDLVVDGLAASMAGAYRLTDSRQGARGRARRGGARGMGCRARERRTRCVPRARPANEGDRDGLAAQGAGRRQRPRRPGLRPRRARPAGRAPRGGRGVPRRATTTGSPRLATYRERLTRALDQAVDGDGRFVASPRVD